VFRPSLAKAGEVLRNREVAGHADFLAAANAHAIHAADYRLVATNDRRDHVIEKPHIAPVFLRIAGVVFGIFLGVAAGAESLVARAGKHDRNNITRRAGGTKSQDGRLHHIGRVGVELGGVVERDPGIEQPGYRLAVGPFHRTLFVMHALGDRLANVLGDEIVVLVFLLYGDNAGCFAGHRAAP
jgi:hypothetical protein